MLKKVSVFLVPVLVFQLAGLSGYAQTQGGPNHFNTEGECQAAVAAGNFQFYRPTILKRIPQRAGEEVLAHPTGGCFLMAIPENLGGRQWVPIESGRLFVYDTPTRGVLRLEECDNTIYAESPFGGARAEANPFTNFRNDVVVPGNSPIRDSIVRVIHEQAPAQQTRTDVDIDVDDDDGMPGWLKAVIIGGAVVGGGYVIWQCAKEGGFCRNDVNNVNQIITIGPPGGITIIQR